MKLTADEIKLVAFIVVALLVGAATRHFRHRGDFHLPPTPSAVEAASKEPSKSR
jgi:hypothetical protein